MEEMEKFYDEEIAPALLEIGEKCQEKGLPFVAVAEYKSGDLAATRTVPAGSGFCTKLVDAAQQANGNVDALIGGLIKHAKTLSPEQNQSIYLRLLMEE